MNSVDASLLIVGDGPLRYKLETQATANSVVRNRVHFLGRIHDVTPYYHACDVFVLPSIARSEAFGIVQLEAMACGKPVINTRLQSSVPFVSLDGVTGITVAPGNPAAIADALNKLMDDAELRQRYGNAALQRVRAEFTDTAMIKRTLDVYTHVAGVPAMIYAPEHRAVG
jgi:rhamnosyl/mannosyltransferase